MKALYKTLLALYLLTLLWLILFKFSLDISSVAEYRTGLNIIPFADASQGDSKEMIANLAVFIPFGLLLGVNFKQTAFWRKLAFVAAFSLVAEIIQFIFALGAADITDVITNSLGGLLGLLIYGVSARHVRGQKLDRFIGVTGVLILAMLLGVLCSGTVRFQSISSADALPSQKPLAGDMKLAWPADGQAAIGNVKDGLLARSSEHEKPRPIASMAKVIAALAILDKRPLQLGQKGPTYKLTAKDVATYHAYVSKGGSVVPVYEGMEVTQYQAMQMMLLASANNIADTLVERTFGSTKAYTSYVQDMLQRMRLKQTVVADASGFSPNTISTPTELVAIGIAALKSPVIAEIVAQPQAQIPGVGVITNTNQLLGTDGVVGVKTGTTESAGSCLLFAARYAAKDGQAVTLVGVIMGDANAATLFSDSRRLLASARQGFGLGETESATDDAPPQLRSRPSQPADEFVDND